MSFAEGLIPPSASRGPLPSLGFGSGPLPFKSFRDLNLKPGVVHKFTDWALGFIGVSLRTPVCLSSFVLKSFVPSARTAYKRADARDIWPVPPPRWSWSGPSNPGAASCILAVVISTLNWLLLGYPKEPPAEARAGAPITAEQSSVQDRLLRYIVRFLRASDFDADSLGRCSEKFDRVAQFIQELPTSGSDVDLESLLHDLRYSLNPYGRPRAKPSEASDSCEHDPPAEISEAFTTPLPQQAPPSLSSTACKPIVAERIRWKYPPTFDPRPFLVDPLARAAFEDPNILRLTREAWPKIPKAKVHGTKAEVLKLASVWDSVGALRIFRKDQLFDKRECVGLFCVPKDASCDRLILNPIVVNARMRSLNTFTKQLAHGCQFCFVHIPPGHVARFSADDLAEFYYTVKVTNARDMRNAISLPLQASDLQGFAAYNPTEHWGTCFIALACLAMGDSLAVELAQQSHMGVLRSLGGCLVPSETVTFRRPFPRGPFSEYLCIDDHITCQVLRKACALRGAPARDTQVFAGASDAYLKVGLVQHPKKKRRGVLAGTFLGADIDGEAGLVSAPRDRVLLLMLCTAEVARRGCARQKLSACCWVAGSMS